MPRVGHPLEYGWRIDVEFHIRVDVSTLNPHTAGRIDVKFYTVYRKEVDVMKAKFPHMSVVLAAACLSAPVFAQVDLSTWDEDGDGSISLEEWDAGMETQGLFNLIDENGNGVFEAEEADEDLFVYDLEMDID